MMIYRLECKQQLNCDIETAWEFFSSAHNLSQITPKEMNFVIVNNISEKYIYEGMIIDYKVTPLMGIRMKWQTKIIQVKPYVSFIDLQFKGPYKLWEHVHEFIPNEQGVLMIDRVRYELPYGFIGQLAHILIIRKKLDRIFDYRYQVLEKMFTSLK